MKALYNYWCAIIIAMGLLANDPAQAQSVVNFLKPNGSPQAVDANHPLPVDATLNPSAEQDVNITKVGGNAVTTSVPVSVGNTVPVTGTFFQSTQPVSIASSVSVTGTATNAVPVTGTFFQTTQPVSGTVGISGTVPVSGTFFQATQPVSIAGTVSTNPPANQSVNLVQIGGSNLLVNGSTANPAPLITGGRDGAGVIHTIAVDSIGWQGIVGNVGTGITDSGSPVKVGCVYTATLPTVTTGQRVDAQCNDRGAIITAVAGTFPVTGGQATGAGTMDSTGSLRALATISSLNDNGSLDQIVGILNVNPNNPIGVQAVSNVPTTANHAGIVPNARQTLGSFLNVKTTGAGNLYHFQVTSTAAGFVMLFDATSAPADGVVTPVECYPIVLGGNVVMDYNIPLGFANGMVIVVSSTGCFIKTSSAVAFISAMAA